MRSRCVRYSDTCEPSVAHDYNETARSESATSSPRWHEIVKGCASSRMVVTREYVG